MEYVNDIKKKLRDMIERERIFYFLVGLNPKFDEVSGKSFKQSSISFHK